MLDFFRELSYNRQALNTRQPRKTRIAHWKLNNMKFRALKSAEISLKHFEKSTSNKEAKNNTSEKRY